VLEVFDDKTKLYIVLELMTGGELFDRIVEKETYNEKEAAEVIRPIVDSIRCKCFKYIRLSFYGSCT
jgi:calcium/calmodulin-dependent protein kinase I